MTVTHGDQVKTLVHAGKTLYKCKERGKVFKRELPPCLTSAGSHWSEALGLPHVKR